MFSGQKSHELSLQLAWLKVASPSMGKVLHVCLSQEWRHQSHSPLFSVYCKAYREAPQPMSGLDGWNQQSTVMQIKCATDTACVIINVILLYQPPPGRKGGVEVGKVHTWRSPAESGPGARSTIRWKQFLLKGSLQNKLYYTLCTISYTLH